MLFTQEQSNNLYKVIEMTFSVHWAIVSDSIEMYQHVMTSTAPAQGTHPLFWIGAL